MLISHYNEDMNNQRGAQSGQVGLVVLLIGAVLLTVGIGVASQSVLESKTARQETESSQTFNYTEQGIEALLGRNLSTSEGTFEDLGVTLEGYTGTYQVVAQPGLNTIVLSGHSTEVKLKLPPATTDRLKIEWLSSPPAVAEPSIIVTIIDANGSVVRYAYDPPGENTRSFDRDSVTQADGTYSVFVPYGSNSALARIKVVYGNAVVRVAGENTQLPEQSYLITATGTKGSGETRTIQVNRGLAAVPSIFDYALFAGTGDLTQLEP